MYDMDVQSNEISKKQVGTFSNRGNFVKFEKSIPMYIKSNITKN